MEALVQLLCLQTAKRSFTFASDKQMEAEIQEALVSKPLSGRSLLQEVVPCDEQGNMLPVSKPLSGRSLLQEGRKGVLPRTVVCLQTAKRSFTFAR